MKQYRATLLVPNESGYFQTVDYGMLKADNHTSALRWIIEKFGVGQNGAYWAVKQVA